MGPHQLMIAQSRNRDPDLLGKFYYRPALFAFSGLSINLDGYIIIVCHASDTFVGYACRSDLLVSLTVRSPSLIALRFGILTAGQCS